MSRLSRPTLPNSCGYAVLLAVLLCLPASIPVRAQGAGPSTAVPLQEYRAALHMARTALLAEPPDMAAARHALAAVQTIVLRSGATADVTPLLGDGTSAITPAEALARVETALQQLDASDGDRTTERRSVLDSVLAGPAFQLRESLLDRLRSWLAEFLVRFFPTPPAQPGPITPAAPTVLAVIGWSAVAGAALVLFLLLSRWLRTLLQAFVADATLGGTDEAGEPATAAEARVSASRSAQAGNYRSAVRHLYLAALLILQEQRIVSRDRSLTNREVLARVPAAHPVRAHLKPIVEIFDEVWYGVHEPDSATFTRYQAEVDALQHSAAHPLHSGETP